MFAARALEALGPAIGTEVAVSGWVVIDQAKIDAFADATGDRQFIHVDPRRACAETPFGGTIAHGFLTLSLLSPLADGILQRHEGHVHGINYGFERVRFPAVVRSGARVRARFALLEAVLRNDHMVMQRHGVTVEIAEEDRPALTADWLTLIVYAT